MVCNIRNFFTYVIIIVICLSYTFAPWKEMPIPPTPGTLGTCYNWLMFNGFRDNNYKNKELVYDRERNIDQYVTYFSAAYAYALSNSSELYDINYFGPAEFCKTYTVGHLNYIHVPLKDAEFICEGWIDLYMYTEDRDDSKINNPDYRSNTFDPSDFLERYNRDKSHDNFLWARNRDQFMDNKISLYAALYFKYITFDLNNALKTPRDICNLLGKPTMNEALPKRYPFMSSNGLQVFNYEWFNESTLPFVQESMRSEINSMEKLRFNNIGTECYDTIKQYYGLTDGSSNNNQMNTSEPVVITNENLFVNAYINYRQDFYSIENDNLMTLENFCKTWHFHDAEILHYYGLV